ncbi:hypothetical protein [Corallococcus carmarthensis]|uniref:Uncharacterized protein n=1 Tax=Corallococcus carmarthensis TaxID=2316728 RepID=A0A3A8K2K6_9BACT|nr:hypothetical protein [Corallococcus carmarthensis]NOK21381.1 hypothetical protein [Corallococcus carmarthensis]RKH01726.1 hypothetical protein D7X32_19430 [Corallococcus carmarthensis]
MRPLLADQAPRSIVLYHPKPTEGWRYAVYMKAGDILDGRLLDSTPSTSFEEARTQMERKLMEFFGRSTTLVWKETSSGWWTGEAVDAPSVPA